MERPRPIVILAISIAMLAVLAFIGHIIGSKKQQDQEYLDSAAELDKIASFRFENDRGLSPCDAHERKFFWAAQSKLIAIGESNADLWVLVEPAFSEPELVVFGADYIRTYRIFGQIDFRSPESSLLSATQQRISAVSLTRFEQFEIVNPIVRHTRYAMTAREYGYDGVNLYFGSGEDSCAFAWTPRGAGPGGLIAEMVAEASNTAPSTEKLLELARSIDRLDSARQAGQ